MYLLAVLRFCPEFRSWDLKHTSFFLCLVTDPSPFQYQRPYYLYPYQQVTTVTLVCSFQRMRDQSRNKSSRYYPSVFRFTSPAAETSNLRSITTGGPPTTKAAQTVLHVTSSHNACCFKPGVHEISKNLEAISKF